MKLVTSITPDGRRRAGIVVDGGVGDATQTYLQPGDVVEAEIERLGRLTNVVQRSL